MDKVKSSFARLIEILAGVQFPFSLKCAEVSSGLSAENITRALNDTQWILGYYVKENEIYKGEH